VWTETKRVAKFSLWYMSQKCCNDCKVHYKLTIGGAPQGAMRVASQIWQVVFASQTLQVFYLAVRKKAQYVVVTPGPSFNHNLCCRCPNGSYEAIFDIYTSRPFQRYKKHLKARSFDLCNRAMKLRESQRTPSSHFWECKSHPHTCLKVGLRHQHYNNIRR
jgi:hypothetical protein